MLFNFVRNFHVGRVLWSADKSNLAKLRKKTGYTFANCKTALEMHKNDLQKAEGWLHEQAQSMGWTKASKLAGRTTAQGLIALRFDKGHASLVELNCETDFVARNEKFQALAEEAANACFHLAHSSAHAKGPLTKMCLDSERLKSLHYTKDKTLGDQLALTIGTVGENATLRRAECWKADAGLHITGYTHPSMSNTSFSTGKYGSLLAFTCAKPSEDVATVGRQLCQHIVGMNPVKIGKEGVDKPTEEADDETCLIHQEFIADPSITVNEVLKQHHITIVDYVRFECGESIDANLESNGQPLENVQTCQ